MALRYCKGPNKKLSETQGAARYPRQKPKPKAAKTQTLRYQSFTRDPWRGIKECCRQRGVHNTRSLLATFHARAWRLRKAIIEETLAADVLGTAVSGIRFLWMVFSTFPVRPATLRSISSQLCKPSQVISSSSNASTNFLVLAEIASWGGFEEAAGAPLGAWVGTAGSAPLGIALRILASSS